MGYFVDKWKIWFEKAIQESNGKAVKLLMDELGSLEPRYKAALQEYRNQFQSKIDGLLKSQEVDAKTEQSGVEYLAGSTDLDSASVSTYNYLSQYQEGKKTRLPKFLQVMDAKTQADMSKNLEKVLSKYNKSAEPNVEEAATAILDIMKTNQARHEEARLATASSFNLSVLQKLPKKLQDEVCTRLGMTEDDKNHLLSEGTGWGIRKALAEKIKKFKPETVEHVQSQKLS